MHSPATLTAARTARSLRMHRLRTALRESGTRRSWSSCAGPSVRTPSSSTRTTSAATPSCSARACARPCRTAYNLQRTPFACNGARATDTARTARTLLVRSQANLGTLGTTTAAGGRQRNTPLALSGSLCSIHCCPKPFGVGAFEAGVASAPLQTHAHTHAQTHTTNPRARARAHSHTHTHRHTHGTPLSNTHAGTDSSSLPMHSPPSASAVLP